MAKTSSREMQRGVEEEEDLLSAQEVPPWHGEAVPARPRWHQARGRRRRHVGKTPHPLIRPKRISFPEHFCYCFSSNLCVLNTTNTD
jgi:hypothetical protein